MARVAAVAAVLAWVNAHPTLSGRGKPLTNGAFRTMPPRSPAAGSYLLLTRIDGNDALTAEEPVDRARIAGVVFAPDDQAAEAAAVAYANALAALTGTRAPMGDDATCLVVDDITGPQLIDDRAGPAGELYAYQVDADFLMINGGS